MAGKIKRFLVKAADVLVPGYEPDLMDLIDWGDGKTSASNNESKDIISTYQMFICSNCYEIVKTNSRITEIRLEGKALTNEELASIMQSERAAYNLQSCSGKRAKELKSFLDELGVIVNYIQVGTCPNSDQNKVFLGIEDKIISGQIFRNENGEIESFISDDGELKYTLKTSLSQDQINASIITYFEDDKKISKYLQKFAADLVGNNEKLVFDFIDASGMKKDIFKAQFGDKASLKALRNAIKTLCNAKSVTGGANGWFNVTAK